MTLSRKILFLALLNMLLLGVVIFVFARLQFQAPAESLVLGPARDRLVGIANAFRLEFNSTPAAARVDLLASYRRRYDAQSFLIDPRGHSLVGSEIRLPQELLERLRGDGRPPPPREPSAEPRFPRGRPVESAFLVITRAPTAYWAGVRIPIAGEDGEDGIPAVLLLRSSSLFNSNLFFDWRLWLGVALTVVAVSALCWLPFIRGLTRSITEVDRATERIAQGQFDVHAPDGRQDELGHLGAQVNRTASRLNSFVKNQKRFLGDIAHELCAPIARIQFALGILEQKVDEAQQQHVVVLREEIQEMSSLVNELLLFSKAGLHAEEAPLAPVGVAGIVERAVSRDALASGPVEVSVDPALSVLAHEGYLLRSVSNLLRNAIRYAGDAGPIAIAARRENGRVLITVSDSGPGLPEAELEEVFAPFYRPEAARSRDTGGIGLGLAIVKSCVEACRGTVTCRNRKPAGLEVTISLAAADC